MLAFRARWNESGSPINFSPVDYPLCRRIVRRGGAETPFWFGFFFVARTVFGEMYNSVYLWLASEHPKKKSRAITTL